MLELRLDGSLPADCEVEVPVNVTPRDLIWRYRNECYMATAMLVRAVMDHIPPIFGMNTFGQVTANYGGGGKSFKQATEHLHSAMRKIADAQLHSQIRRKESLLNQNSVHFQADLDFVLAEVVRVLK